MVQEQIKLPPEIEQGRDAIKSSIYGHTRFVHGYSLKSHHQSWVRALEDMSIKRVVLVAPPKYGKTPTVGLDYLGWRIGNNSSYHGIYVSNTATQANKPSVALRDTIAYNKKYRWLYGLEPDVYKGWSEMEWFVKRPNESDKDPTLQACGVGGPLLGATVDEVIFDDVADPENMATAYQRQKTIEWLKKVPMSRLVPGVSRAIMICTRWHEEDPAAHFIEDGWMPIELKAIDEEGNSTYPEYWTLDDLENSRVDLGHRDFELMFQGRVLPEEGGVFKREWWRYWRQGEAPWQIEGEGHQPIQAIVQTWDTAHKEKQQNDYSACETWAVTKGGYYLMNAWKAKLNFPKLKIAFVNVYKQFNPMAVLVEDAASGQDLIAEMKVESTIPIIAIQVSRDKVARAHAVTPTIEAGNVYIPEEASWRQEWEYEHEVFPAGAHDDWVDCTTQFLNWIRTHSAGAPSTPSELKQQSKWRD